MIDRPIIMSAPMVKALLREIEEPGTGKTQTRRVMENRAANITTWWKLWREWRRGERGQRIWVREALCLNESDELCYAADSNKVAFARIPKGFSVSRRKAPGMHMARWASRITLDVTDVRHDAVKNISEEDAKAEGVERPRLPHWPGEPYRSAFRGLWCDLHGPDAWDNNPTVVIITFTPRLANIDEQVAA